MGVRSGFLKKITLLVCIFTLLFDMIPSGIICVETQKLSMSYIYFGTPEEYISYVNRTKGSLNGVFTDYFNLNADGTLKLTSKIDSSFIREMHNKGIKVIPYLSNHWDREAGRNALAGRTALAQQIANAVRDYNLDGVNIDIEGMNELDRDNYTDFVRILRGKLPAGKVLSVAVASNPNGFTKGWQGSYDYSSLALYSDYIIVMAYDEHYEGGGPGPVASASFVERSIQYALEKVPKEKIILGIPFYGRYWKEGDTYSGYGANMDTVQKLIEKYNGNAVYDRSSQSLKAVVTIKPGDETARVGHRELTAGTYIIWGENEESIKYKLRLVQKYDLKGTASWSLSQETGNTWDYYSLWLNGRYFADTESHWAQDSILAVEQKGWMKGTSSTEFSPDTPLTRAQAAVILVRALGFENGDSGFTFTDISSHWAKEEIEIAARHGIVQGKGGGIFSPDESITREQMTVMLDRVLKSKAPVTIDNPYKDIWPDDWAYIPVLSMTQQGVLTGYPDGNFHPEDDITRAQMATLMSRISESLP